MLASQTDNDNTCLIFEISKVLFSVDTRDVDSVIEPPTVTAMPVMPDYVLGSFSYRGHAASAVDSRRLLHLAEVQGDTRRAFVVSKVNNDVIAFEVDRVVGIVPQCTVKQQQNLFTQAGVNVHHLEGHGLAVHLSFLQLLANADQFALDEWQQRLNDAGLVQTTVNEESATDNVVSNEMPQEDELTTPEVKPPAASLPEAFSNDVDDEFDNTEVSLASHQVNDETAASMFEDTSRESKTNEEWSEPEPKKIEPLSEYETRNTPNVASQTIVEDLSESYSAASSLSEAVEETSLLVDPPSKFEHMPAAAPVEDSDWERFNDHNIRHSDSAKRRIISETTPLEDNEPADRVDEVASSARFKETKLPTASRKIFSTNAHGPIYYWVLATLILLFVVTTYSWFFASQRNVSPDVLNPRVSVPDLTENLVERNLTDQDMSISEHVVNEITDDFNSGRQRIVDIATPEFSITVDRPGSSPKKVEQKEITINLVGQSLDKQKTLITETSHTVVAGDTLWGIAQVFLENPFRYPELAKDSGIRDPNLIYPGDVVTISRYDANR